MIDSGSISNFGHVGVVVGDGRRPDNAFLKRLRHAIYIAVKSNAYITETHYQTSIACCQAESDRNAFR
jgi:hypothetical protein